MSVSFRVSGDLEHLESLLVRGVRRVQLLLEGDELAGVEVEARCERCPARCLLEILALCTCSYICIYIYEYVCVFIDR